MHTIKLQVQDAVYDHIMFLLRNLNPQELKILEDKVIDNTKSVKSSIQKLFETKNMKVFESIDDPLAWQKQQRDEW